MLADRRFKIDIDAPPWLATAVIARGKISKNCIRIFNAVPSSRYGGEDGTALCLTPRSVSGLSGAAPHHDLLLHIPLPFKIAKRALCDFFRAADEDEIFDLTPENLPRLCAHYNSRARKQDGVDLKGLLLYPAIS